MNLYSQFLTFTYNIIGSTSSFQEDLTMKECPSFGHAEWEKYFGIKVDQIPIPDSLLSSLDDPCPYWANKKVRETHLLCLIPSGFTSEEIWKKCTPRKRNLFVEDISIPIEAYWILITKKILPESNSTNFKTFKEKISSSSYSVPTFLEATVAILALRKSQTLQIFSPPVGYTKCQESLDGSPIAIGSAEYGILGTLTNDLNCESGVAVVRKA